MNSNDMQKLLIFLQSPSGKQLVNVLKKQNGITQAQEAAALAASGNLDLAKQHLSGLLDNQEIQSLLHQLEGLL